MPILQPIVGPSYAILYGSDYIDISDTLMGIPETSDYTLEFIQDKLPNPNSGVRALEFEAIGNISIVPQPSSLALLCVGGIALCARRPRRI